MCVLKVSQSDWNQISGLFAFTDMCCGSEETPNVAGHTRVALFHEYYDDNKYGYDIFWPIRLLVVCKAS